MLLGPAPFSQLAPLPAVTSVAIGVFDGVHLGHQAVVRSLGGTVAALTFEPHPLALIAPERTPPRLTSLAQKRELLAKLQAVAVVALRFDSELRQLSAAEFVARLVHLFPALREVAIGEGWAFGRHREGDVIRLAELGRAHGFAARAIAPILVDGAPVSSTRIRQAIGQRQFELAHRLLGRSYAVTGRVIPGDARGRTLGFPTANLAEVEQLLPPRGVYAAQVSVAPDPQVYSSVLNLGQRPTFTSNGRDSLEVHLLDFSGDLYGREMTVSALTFLREEQRFSGLAALQEQIARDVARARALPLPLP